MIVHLVMESVCVIRDLMVEGLSTSSNGECLSDQRFNGGGVEYI